MAQSICFVLDFEGDDRWDTGLDLYYRELIHLLANQGWDVSVVYFPLQHKEYPFSPLYLNRDIKDTVHLYEAERLCRESNSHVTDLVNYHKISWKSHIVHEALQVLQTKNGTTFDIIEFLDGRAQACIPLRMDRNFKAYNDSKILVKLAEPYPVTTTLNEKEWYTLNDLLLEDLEHYSFDHADLRLSVSNGYIEFLKKDGWEIKGQVPVSPFPIQKFKREYQGTKTFRNDIFFFNIFDTNENSSNLKELFLQIIESDEKLEKLNIIIVDGNDPRKYIPRPGSHGRFRKPFEAVSETTFWNYLKENRPQLIIFPFHHQNNSEFFYLYYLYLLRFMQLQIPILTTKSPHLKLFLGTDVHQVQDIFLPEHKDQEGIRQKVRSILLKDSPNYDIRFFNGLTDESRILSFYEEARTKPKQPTAHPPQKEPDITIVIPYYNAGHFIEKSLRSLKNQSYRNSKIIIVNDGSTDPFSVQMLEKIKHADKTILIINKENGGIGSALNYALREVTSKYIIEFDADNIATPLMIERFVTAMENRDDVVGLSAYAKGFTNDEEKTVIREIDENTYILKKFILFFGSTSLSLFFDNTCGDATTILRTETIKAVGGWPEDRRGFQDWPLWLKLLAKGYHIDIIPEALYYYRWRSESDTSEKDTFGIDASNMPHILEILSKDNNFQYIYPKLHRVIRGAFPVSEVRTLKGVYSILLAIQTLLGRHKSLKKVVSFYFRER